MKITFCLAAILFSANYLKAADVDEKFTIRLLSVSNSKKTVLINRGSEDGLNVGEHAKFFQTDGVVARAVVEKVSPSRSVWSVYRIINASELEANRAMNMKMTTPVKVTDDPTKSLSGVANELLTNEKVQAVKGTERLPKAEASSDNEELNPNLNEMEKKDVPETKKEKTNKPKLKSESEGKPFLSEDDEYALGQTSYKNYKKNLRDDMWDIYSLINANFVSGSVTVDDPAIATSGVNVDQTIDTSIGLERYFFTHPALERFSIGAFFHYRNVSTGDTTVYSTQNTEFGGFFHYHFFNKTYAREIPVFFVETTIAMGHVTANINNVISGSNFTSSGSNNAFSVGVGIKYLFANGIGLRSILDYRYSQEKMTADQLSAPAAQVLSYTQIMKGVRVNLGISYRF